MDELVEREVERTNLEHTDILRWEDDGGQAIEYRVPADRLNPEPAGQNKQPITLPATRELE